MKILFIAIISVMFAACSTNKSNTKSSGNSTLPHATTANTEMNIPFTEAQNYFVNNTFKADSLADPKITDQKGLESIFGMATTMDDKPTAIDFSKQYVIAIIQPVTDKATSLTIKSLTKKENNIVLLYTKTEGEKKSYTTRPFLLLIIDNTYTGNIVIKRE